MTQRVDATDQVAKQLERLKAIEKSDVRMIEADRQRFRIKYRKGIFPKVDVTASAASASAVKRAKTNDPTVPGLGDHRQAIATNNRNESIKQLDESGYQAARSLVFTGDQVDLDKILCLHLLTVHVLDIDEDELRSISGTNGPLSVVAEQSGKGSSNADDILPRYVVEIQRDESSQLQQSSPAPREPAPGAQRLLAYVHTGRTPDESGKPQRVQSSTLRDIHDVDAYSYVRSVCKHDKYFTRPETASAVGTLSTDQRRQILICFNAKLANFVRSVVNALRYINLEKTNALLDVLENSQVITRKLSQMNDFVNSLGNFSLVTSPNNYSCVAGYATEDARSRDDSFATIKGGQRAFAETLILESDALRDFTNLLDKVRRGIGDFVQKSSRDVPTIRESSHERLSRQSSVDKNESSGRGAARSYDAIQQEYNEAAIARLLANKNIKRSKLYCSDPDRVAILRRMTNSQRILVGQTCAALKTKQINNDGIAKDKIPLAVLLKPVLSRQSISYLTQGRTAICAKDDGVEESKAKSNTSTPSIYIDMTDFTLTKIHQEIIEVESQSQLQRFMNNII